MSKTTRFTADGPPHRDVIVPDNALAEDAIGRDAGDVKIEMDNPTPEIADDIILD